MCCAYPLYTYAAVLIPKQVSFLVGQFSCNLLGQLYCNLTSAYADIRLKHFTCIKKVLSLPPDLTKPLTKKTMRIFPALFLCFAIISCSTPKQKVIEEIDNQVEIQFQQAVDTIQNNLNLISYCTNEDHWYDYSYDYQALINDESGEVRSSLKSLRTALLELNIDKDYLRNQRADILQGIEDLNNKIESLNDQHFPEIYFINTEKMITEPLRAFITSLSSNLGSRLQFLASEAELSAMEECRYPDLAFADRVEIENSTQKMALDYLINKIQGIETGWVQRFLANNFNPANPNRDKDFQTIENEVNKGINRNTLGTGTGTGTGTKLTDKQILQIKNAVLHVLFKDFISYSDFNPYYIDYVVVIPDKNATILNIDYNMPGSNIPTRLTFYYPNDNGNTNVLQL